MHIAGLQKLSLLDFPDKMCCIVFTAGCNLRCPFCHNAELVLSPPPPMPESEFFAFLEKRKGVLEGVCISGGEPLLQTDLPEFISKIKAMGFAVKLDTNGFFPTRLASLLQAGLLDYIAMDIKNSPSKYALTCGTSSDLPMHLPAPKDYSLIKESAKLIMNSGVDYEFRTTVVRGFHDNSDIDKIGKDFRGAKRFFLQTFVDSGATITSGLFPFSPEEMQNALTVLQQYVPNAKIR